MHELDSAADAAAFERECRAAMADALQDVQVALARSAELIARAGSDPARRALAHVARSHAQCYAGDLIGGLATLDAVSPTRDQLDGRLQALMANAAVQPLLRLGRFEEANNAARRAVEAAERLGAPQEVAKALVSLGATERLLGRTEQAAAVLARAEQLAGPEEAIAAAAAGNLAECLLDLDRFDDALACFERAADTFEKVGRQHAAAISRGNIADVLGRLGRLDPAMLAFEHARRAFESSGAELDAARLSCEEGEMLLQAGALRAARDRYAAALPTLEAADAGADLARARLALGSVLVALGDARSARSLLEAAAFAAPEDSILLAETALALARCDSAEGRSPAAETRLRAVLPALEHRPARAARARLQLAHVLLEQQCVDAARDLAQQASDAIDAAGLDCLQPLASAFLARVAAALQQPVDAVRLADEAFEQAAAIVARTATPAGRAGLVHAYADLASLTIALRLEHAPHTAPDAIVRADDLAASIAAPSVHEPSGNQPPHASVADLQARLERANLAIARLQLEAGAFREAGAPGRLATLQAEAALLTERLRAWSDAPTPPSTGAETISRRLPPGTVVVHWLQDGEQLSALVLDDAGPPRLVRTLIGRATLEAMGRRLAFIAAEAAAGSGDRAADAWRQTISDLHDRIIKPLQLAPDSRATFNCPPWTRTIPWTALRPAATVSFSLRDALRAPRRPAPTPHVVFLATDDPSLPLASREVHEAARAWLDVDVQVGGRADDLLERVRHADVLHLATHGVFVPDRPGMSRFLLGDRWITVQELAPAVRPGAVIILSACHAGRSGGVAEDAIAIPGVLRTAGAHAVVAPIWPLGDQSAATLFPLFHHRLAERWSQEHAVRESLTEAIGEVLRQAAASTEVHGVLVCGGVAS